MLISKPLHDSLRESLEQRATLYESQMSREAAQYLMGRGIARDTAERFRLGFVAEPWSSEDERFLGRLAIPAIGPRGNVYGMKFRALTDDVRPKYHGLSVPARPFNLRAITESASLIVVCEGELDAIILEQCGLHAVGIPGVDNWKREWSRMFVGFSEVIVVGDNDPAETKDGKPGHQGQNFSARLAKEIYASRRVLLPEEGDDINTIYLRGGEDLVLDVLGIKRESV